MAEASELVQEAQGWARARAGPPSHTTMAASTMTLEDAVQSPAPGLTQPVAFAFRSARAAHCLASR